MAEYEGDQARMIDHINDLCWYQRGGLSRDEAWSLSYRERVRIMKQAEARMKTTEKIRMPLV